MDTTELGTTAANLMERLTDEAEDRLERGAGTTELGEVMVLAEITVDYDDGVSATWIEFRCSNPKDWIQRGMLRSALVGRRELSDVVEEEEDGDGDDE